MSVCPFGYKSARSSTRRYKTAAVYRNMLVLYMPLCSHTNVYSNDERFTMGPAGVAVRISSPSLYIRNSKEYADGLEFM